MKEVVLVIIFNHRFDKNLPVLRRLYGQRFSHVQFLVPFYDGNDNDVIPVFEESYYFQGFLPQAMLSLNKTFEQASYVVIGDDLILHPSLTEQNIIEELQLDNETAFLAENWGSLTDHSMQWPNFMPSVNAFYQKDSLKHHAVNWKTTLPKKEEAQKKLENAGFKFGKIDGNHLKGYDGTTNYGHYKNRRWNYYKLIAKRRRSLPYPIVTGYSDFIVFHSGDSCDRFLEYCELFRRMRLWVECAIPTAMYLAYSNVKTEEDLDWKGKTYWPGFFSNKNGELIEKLEKRAENANFELGKLLENFGEKELYMHPIKLSQWQ